MKNGLVLNVFLILISGCSCFPGAINSWKKELPPYMQKNIGEVKVEYGKMYDINRLGWVNPDTCIIHLHPFSSKRTFFHEAMHSFEFIKFLNDVNEWSSFYITYIDVEYGGHTFICYFLPPTLLPAKDAPNLYSIKNHWENTAETFVMVMYDKKTKSTIVGNNMEAIRKFVNGEFEY